MRAFLLVAVIIVAVTAVSGCRHYGYHTQFGGGPHVDGTPEWTLPVYLSHRPVPSEELKEVYPPDLNVSTK
ncbi:MAG: hypothetical protein NT045_09080 [Candidatus Aureabacteria bacterium]|nr:hypothetical protein [Candidatus Auribacterota bacterium]